MKNLNFFFLLAFMALIMGMVTTTSCSKSSSTPAAKDSVLYSNWITLKMISQGVDNDVTSPTYGYEIFAEEIAAPAITKAVLNKGVVLTYVQGVVNGDTAIVNAEALLSEFVYAGRIELSSVGIDYSGLKYRYVVIPGRIATTKYHDIPVQQLRSMPPAAILSGAGQP
ncbi:MAG TPA: hypothetical protein VE035_06670 [Puia sp.]|nr:hypothetical protein [Puia sp.]